VSQTDGRPRNFDQIFTAAKQIITYFRESDEKTWLEKYEALWFQKLKELASLVFSNKQLQDYLSYDDLSDRLYHIVFYLSKDIKDITDEDLEKYLEKLLGAPESYEFFFPAMELFGFPEGYRLGLCELHSFPQLPPQAQTRISSDWKYRYDDEKAAYSASSIEDYEKQKKQETYFCLKVEASGFNKAIEMATERANQALKILKCFYLLEPAPRLRACHYLRGSGSGAVREERFKWGWYRHRIVSEIEEYVQTVNDFIQKRTDDEIARRCLSAIETYGMIESETPLELKFLLLVMATEGLLLGRDDKDFLGWKLREKVAILLGDTPGWFREFLQKEVPTQEECNESRVAARADLAKKVGEMYDKRSALVHRDDEAKKLAEEDVHFASMVMRFSLQKILRLYAQKGIRRVSKVSTVDPQSVDGFIESAKYSVPMGW
jgi:hypothetical protein